MAGVTIQIDEELEKEFVIVVEKKFGIKRGNRKMAAEIAIKEWIAKNKK
jgi:hypothetical protein